MSIDEANFNSFLHEWRKCNKETEALTDMEAALEYLRQAKINWDTKGFLGVSHREVSKIMGAAIMCAKVVLKLDGLFPYAKDSLLELGPEKEE